jgi:Uma2 family endonuclease
MSAVPQQKFTEAEYLAFENASETKHEYFHGEIFAMAGASPEHDGISVNVIASLHAQLRQHPCNVFSSDVRVKVKSTRLYTYPDVSVVCGEAEFTQDKPPSLLNPTLLVEVLSPSTESYDRGAKFRHYRMFESLQEYVLIAQDTARIEVFTRQGTDTWIFKDAIDLDSVIELKSIGCSLALADVYEKVTLPEVKSPLIPDADHENNN